MAEKTTARRFLALFDGLPRAYGTYRVTGTEGDKHIGVAATVHGAVTEELWERHLRGEQGIGVIPIRDDSSCLFGAIDVDEYKLDFKCVLSRLKKKGFPLVPCRTKSGGLHLYLFLDKPHPAAELRASLRTIAAALGFSGSEVFPKQAKVLTERGDLGSWINMPYFGGDATERYALDEEGKRLDLVIFLDRAEKSRCAIADIKLNVASTGDLIDGPPCLAHLVLERNVEAGTRNDVLFNLAIYLKRAVPDTWLERVNEYNKECFTPPLEASEVSAVTKSVARREYLYTCSKPPLKTYCDKGVCRARKHGTGAWGDFPTLTALSKYDTQPPIWFLDVDTEDGGRIELTTEELQTQLRFQRKCMECLNLMPPIIKPGQWQSLIQSLMEGMTVIAAPLDASAVGQLLLLLDQFCTSKVQARVKEEILLGKPWLNEGRHYFRLSDFMQFLDRKKFKEFKVSKIAQVLRDAGAEHQFMKLRGKGVNVWSVRQFERQTEEQLPVPKLGTEGLI